MTRYAAQLGSITQGQGSYTMEFSHYDMVPGNVQQQIVSKAKMATTRTRSNWLRRKSADAPDRNYSANSCGVLRSAYAAKRPCLSQIVQCEG